MECDFCGAVHPGPNEPGMCVKYWQEAYDRVAKALDDCWSCLANYDTVQRETRTEALRVHNELWHSP